MKRAEGALRDIIAAYKSHRAAKLIWEEAFALSNKRCKAPVAGKEIVPKRGQSSWLHRMEKRAADPAVPG